MTVKELRDKLDNYIKHDSPDTWQINDVEAADAQAYKERCKDRENQQIVILDDGMKPRYFAAEAAFGVPVAKEIMPGTYVMSGSFAISADLTHEIT